MSDAREPSASTARGEYLASGRRSERKLGPTHGAQRARRPSHRSHRAGAPREPLRARHGRARKPPRAPFGPAVLLVFVLVLASAGGFLLLRDRGAPVLPGPPQASGRPGERDTDDGESRAPSYYSDVESGDAFRSIFDRSADPQPLTVDEVFAGAAQAPSYQGVRLSLSETRLDSNCAAAVWGQQLKQDLQRNGCSQVVRGLYIDADRQLVCMVAIFNMKDVEGAAAIIEVMNPEHQAGFVLPPAGAGQADRLGGGYSEAHAHAMGHYVFVRWAQRLDGSTPSPHASGEVSDANVALTDAQWAIRRRLLAAG